MDWMADNAWMAWLGVAIVLAAIEAATVAFVFIMFAAGALAGSIAAALGAPFFFQVVVAVVAAMALLLLVRPWLKRRFMDTGSEHKMGANALLGRQAWVLQTVTATDGRVKVGGETWSARLAEDGDAVGPGEEVRVVAIHGATCIVVPATLPQAP